jgi:squalene-hopene/tetraprenyl-beta-curcumene cyclase
MTSVLTETLPASDSRVTRGRLAGAYAEARARLLSQREAGGHWAGELSSSALSTATAVCALLLVDERRHAALARGGARWLLENQNEDGGWGDTVRSVSNISTTMLCRAALTVWKRSTAAQDGSRAANAPASSGQVEIGLRRAESYLEGVCGGLDSATLACAVRRRYGKDHTFSVPILCCCALAGLVDWKEVPALPFELACFPSAAYRRLNLPVVSYALPALISLGLLIHNKRPPSCPVTRAVRRAAAPRALRKLEAIQPENGGFLEAAPLVSFVTMGLAGAGLAAHPVVERCVQFLRGAVRADGSWPIDTNLSTWVTTLSINALGDDGPRDESANKETDARDGLRRWLLGQQYRSVHPFTSAAPGGWGWTPLPGAVPDADDTAGALLALHNLGAPDEARAAAVAGLRWLLDLQNRDGGFPTFCRGWGYLPFDRSSADITAHALRALNAWAAAFDAPHHSGRDRGQAGANETPFGSVRERAALLRRIRRAVEKGVNYLERAQRADGSWLPLWFGNQHAPDDENPTYGTARVLAAFRDLGLWHTEAARRGRAWLVAAQHESGGWGGAAAAPPSVEETALAVEALTDGDAVAGGDGAAQSEAVARGLRWLVERVEDGSYLDPSPIGFYFAKLWYFERLYPLVFTVGALGRALRLAEAGGQDWVQAETSAEGIYV